MILYRVGLTLLAPVVALALLWRLLLGRERRADAAERLGLGPARPRGGERAAEAPRLWLHGASNGELTAARPLIQALLDAGPELSLLLTCNTTTARDMARGWGMPRVTVRLAPLDYRTSLGALLRLEMPTAMAVIENELWPNKLSLARRDGMPVALIGARVSARSARRWRHLQCLIRPMLQGVALALPQDQVSGERLIGLGLKPDALGTPVVLKAAVALDRPAPDAVRDLGFERANTVLAASTHDGEEEQVLAAFVEARAVRPALRLILAPRHPARGAQVASLVAAAGLACAIRSAGDPPGDAPVFLADTLGEMPLWYASAGICFIGGSLVEKGGHTPYEPAQFGCALISGPNVENAAEAFTRLTAAEAVRIVQDAPDLAQTLGAMTPDVQNDLGKRAMEALSTGAPASGAQVADRLIDVLRLSTEARQRRA
ncbi:MAG: glycosyltransferase N-terminal domain-containing protein [Pseudomonadota bacterium]